MVARATFEVTGWDEEPYAETEGSPKLSQATVRKSFVGAISGSSEAQVLMCRSDADNLEAGGGYIASDVFSGSVDGKEGSFVFQHGGLMFPDGKTETFGTIVPGSGRGELAGISGTTTISVEDGVHTLTLDYNLG